MVLVTYSQLQSENIKWKFQEIMFHKFVFIAVVLSGLMKRGPAALHPAPKVSPPLSSTPLWKALPTHLVVTSYQTISPGIEMLEFKELILPKNGLKHKL